MNEPIDYKVFNRGVNAPVTLTLSFERAEDAAWVERAIVECKRDGQLSRLMGGILRDSLKGVAHPPVVRDSGGAQYTPEELKTIRCGRTA